MITRELILFIKKSRAEGRTDEEMRTALIQGGWHPADVEDAFRQIKLTSVAQSESSPSSPVYGGSTMSHNPSFSHQSYGSPFANPAYHPQVKIKEERSFAGFFTALVVLGLVGGGFYYRNDLKQLPIIEDFFPYQERGVAILDDITPPQEPLQTPSEDVTPTAPSQPVSKPGTSSPKPSATTSQAQPTTSTQTSTLAAQTNIGSAAEAKRQAIYQAARVKNYTQLAALADPSIQYYVDGQTISGGFAEFLKRADENEKLSSRNIFMVVTSLLKMSNSTSSSQSIWPAAALKPANQWTSADTAELRTLLGADEVQGMQMFGNYVYYKIVITTDGRWVGFMMTS